MHSRVAGSSNQNRRNFDRREQWKMRCSLIVHLCTRSAWGSDLNFWRIMAWKRIFSKIYYLSPDINQFAPILLRLEFFFYKILKLNSKYMFIILITKAQQESKKIALFFMFYLSVVSPSPCLNSIDINELYFWIGTDGLQHRVHDCLNS